MSAETPLFDKVEFRRQLTHELTDNILPFWMNHVVDKANGGFYGAVSNDLQVHNEVPRASILCARILWTYSAAYRRLGAEEYLATAQWAYDYLTRVFWDQECEGVYWQVDLYGRPVFDRKHHYAQAFAIYGLTEYYRATQEPESLALAQRLFHLLERYAFEPKYGGYIEGSSRKWTKLDDMRLGESDLNCRKSMNTLLHMLEAYTNLLRVWGDPTLKAQHRALIETILDHVIDHSTGHFKLFLDDNWHSLSGTVSYGHDIEGSWLLLEAANVQGDAPLIARVRKVVTQMAAVVVREGLDSDGSVFNEGNAQGVTDTVKSWWAQAEAMVGFYNAYEVSHDDHFAQAAYRLWKYIQTKLVDRTHGDWYKQLLRDGTPDLTRFKAGPWDCPYHHSRACFEMLNRLEVQAITK